MNELIKQYKELKEQIEGNNWQIELLEKTDLIKRYIRLIKEKNNLIKEQYKLYEQIKTNEYETCNHILICDYSEFYSNNITYYFSGCIKCGLENSVLRRPINSLNQTQKIMYNYLQNHHLVGIELDLISDLKLARAIYKKIKQNYPNISDELATKYFEIALDNIINIKVSRERKVSRAKRLSLEPNYFKKCLNKK